MTCTNRDRSTVVHALLTLLLVLLFPGLAAGYSDPQKRFSVDSPRGWQIRTDGDGARKAILEALEGVPSLTILAREVSETSGAATQPLGYERIVGSAGAHVIVVEMKTESVEVAGHPAVRKTYKVVGPRLRRARVIAVFTKVGRLSLTLAAAAPEQGFSRIESLFGTSLSTLRFSRSVAESASAPPSGEEPATQVHSKSEELEEALRQGKISRVEYVRRKAALAFYEDVPERPQDEDGYRLSYRVRPGSEFRVRMVTAGTMATETPGLESGAHPENTWKYELETVQSILAADEAGAFTLRVVTKPETAVMLVGGVQQDVGRVPFPEMTIRMSPQDGALGLTDQAKTRVAATDRRFAGFMSLRNSFPRLPDRNVRIGERWELQESPSGGEAQGFVQFTGIEEVQGQRCAVLHVHSNMPVTLPGELEEGFAREGLRMEGRIETDMHQFFALDLGWPIMGDGGTVYETNVLKDGEPVSHTSFRIDMNYEIPF